MKKLLLFIFTGVIGVIAFAQVATTKPNTAKRIEMKDFFKNAEKSGFRISPDGNFFSYRADYKGKMNLFVQKVGDTKAIRVTNDTIRSIFNYFWKGNHILYLQDVGGDENFQLFSVQTDGGNLRAITPFPGYRTDLLDDLHYISGKEKEVMINLNKRNKEYFDPYLVNIETGELTLLYDNNKNYDSWYVDNEGTIRMATKTDGVNITYLYRAAAKDSFSTLITTSFKDQFNPQAFDAANKNIYALSNIGRDKIALVLYDPAKKKEVKELYANSEYDLEGIDYDKKAKKLIRVTWTGEKSEDHYFDPAWKAISDRLKTKFKNYEVDFTSYDDEREKAIIWTSNDRLPGVFYTYDFTTKATTKIADAYPWLMEQDLAFMKPVTYSTRDGITIHGYLTLPKGVAAANLPVIINPHGGPWARDEWGYNPEVQFLANRGYAVLQMNYRGSTGYGKKFWESSFKQWGKKMQEDLSDGVSYLIKNGIADPKRVAIYGGSYGGYATLAGVAFTPELYACAVDYVGVSNLFTFMKTIPPYWKPYLDMFYQMVGDPKKDSLLMAEASPVLHADKIRAPLFVAQGANDPRVNKDESDQMVKALQARGVQVEYMVKNDEGHGFHNQDNRFDFYDAMEKFLDKYLKKPM
ncbi:MAG: S9 family peptidase [Ferruginibacter sp.]